MNNNKRAYEQGHNWMFDVLIDCRDSTERQQWLDLDITEFNQILVNANCPPIPEFETDEETEKFFEGAWDELEARNKMYRTCL